MFQGTGGRMMQEPTALAPFTMKFMVDQSERSRYALEDLSRLLPLHSG